MYIKTYIGICIFFLLSFFFPLLLFKDNFNITFNAILSYLIVSYASFKLSYLSIKNEQRLLEMTFLIFTYIWMGLAPLGHSIIGTYNWGVSYYPSLLFTRALLMVILGITFYEIGLYWFYKKEKKEKKKGKKTITSTRKMTKQWVLILSLVSFTLSILLYLKIGGISSMVATRGELAELNGDKLATSSKLIVSNLKKVPLFVCLIIVLYLNKLNSQAKGINKEHLALLVFLLVVNFIISNPVTNGRYWAGTVLISLLLIVFKWRKYNFSIWVISLVSLLLVVFPYADLFRRGPDAQLKIKAFSYQLTQKGDYDAFQTLMNTIDYVDLLGVEWGRQFVGAIFFWVPRGIWHSKPISTGQLVAEFQNYNFTNLSSPLWAESYINFGCIGIILIFFGYGYLSGFLQKKFLENNHGNNVSIYRVIFPFLVGYQIFLLRGDLMNGIAFMSFFILLSVLFIHISPKKIYKLTF
ncbi:O-antigen polysaccharide polymerase Wzy [Priestia aryabhattai]|uniref:O-antigen polysaccharide polymerase Wzy n=1 Tax=Priestia aryabhattai TaxID=412384 RepID=UPI002E1BC82D|nr:O-antigen polysaccharide polymerase Wzy [Priestia aryabhattai]